MKNPITRLVYLAFSVALIYAFFDTKVSEEKFTLMVYLVGAITFGLIVRAESIGTIFINISEGLKEKWKK